MNALWSVEIKFKDISDCDSNKACVTFNYVFITILITATSRQEKQWLWATPRFSSQALILSRYTVGSGRLLMWLGVWGFSFNVVWKPELGLCGTLPGRHRESEALIRQSGTTTDGCNLLPSTLSLDLAIKGKFIQSRSGVVLFLCWRKVWREISREPKQSTGCE